jgi:hypothetical protein
MRFIIIPVLQLTAACNAHSGGFGGQGGTMGTVGGSNQITLSGLNRARSVCVDRDDAHRLRRHYIVATGATGMERLRG